MKVRIRIVKNKNGGYTLEHLHVFKTPDGNETKEEWVCDSFCYTKWGIKRELKYYKKMFGKQDIVIKEIEI